MEGKNYLSALYCYSDVYTKTGDRGGTVVKVLATNRKVAGSIQDGVTAIFH